MSISDEVRIPTSVTDLDSFREWACSNDFPEHGRFSYLSGELWVDLSMEKLIHNLLKAAISAALENLTTADDLGLFLVDGMLLTNTDVLLSTEPDAMFVSHRSLSRGAVEIQEGDDAPEVVGTPDMVLEVVSKSSVKKDTELLRDLYWQAGVAEYWLVDSRPDDVELEILRHSSQRYASARNQAGWVKSHVFDKAFRLVRHPRRHGISRFSLESR